MFIVVGPQSLWIKSEAELTSQLQLLEPNRCIKWISELLASQHAPAMATPTGQLSFRKIWRNIYWMGEEAAVLAAVCKTKLEEEEEASRTLTLLSWVGAVISSWCNFITVLYVGHFLLEEDDKFLDKV
ncbi:uncharacterized protein LOC127150164 isoform X2 [Cucumis melo]|uniref:Uncharacterized protein LOC127150164 isoform X2 n=1 Tax=Cucumis melo TaxID=3656 RepID=A0ABM3KZ60_CUCME|nr:uncharacterized protein LOC127150164 isoform X2 [Cucumis melo]